MIDNTNRTISRREFGKRAGQIAAASALSALVVPHVHAAENNTINVALIGCGGRGSGAVVQALKTTIGPTKLTCMVDVFQDKLDKSYRGIAGMQELKEQIDVPPERRFIGFDGYQKAMDSLKPGDVAILTTPPAFRWVQFAYAIKKGLNVFMEKPVTVDGPTTVKMRKLGEEASAKNLKVGVG
jgi:predicted dehydrogenase